MFPACFRNAADRRDIDKMFPTQSLGYQRIFNLILLRKSATGYYYFEYIATSDLCQPGLLISFKLKSRADASRLTGVRGAALAVRLKKNAVTVLHVRRN